MSATVMGMRLIQHVLVGLKRFALKCPSRSSPHRHLPHGRRNDSALNFYPLLLSTHYLVRVHLAPVMGKWVLGAGEAHVLEYLVQN